MQSAGRIASMLILTIVLQTILSVSAFAGLFSGDDKGKSGLDFAGGYDINTVTTMSGRATSLPQSGEQGSMIVTIRSGSETQTVCLGPGAYWEKRGIAISLNDDLTVKGSKAQGQDGKSYVLAQRLTNKTTGAQVELRSDRGEPIRYGRNDGRGAGDPGGAMRNQGGGMMRSGGGMMRR